MTAKILLLDIETMAGVVWSWGMFNQNFGLNQVIKEPEVISFAAKFLGDKHVYFASIHDIGKEEMLLLAHELLSEADIVVEYNGDRFDIPHLQREMYEAGMKPPTPFKTLDILKTVRKEFRFFSNKLDHILKKSGLGGKVKHQGFQDWIDFVAGDPVVYARFKRYNIADVTKLERLYKKLLPWIKSHPNLNIYSDNTRPQCPKCEGNLIKQGLHRAVGGLYQRYKCKDCGGWSQDTKRLSGATVKGVS